MNRFNLLCILTIFSIPSFSQANFNVTDPEKSFKEAKDFFVQEQYSLAYPLLQQLKQQYPENTGSSHTYLNQDIEYFYVVCGLILVQPVAEVAAKRFIAVAAATIQYSPGKIICEGNIPVELPSDNFHPARLKGFWARL